MAAHSGGTGTPVLEPSAYPDDLQVLSFHFPGVPAGTQIPLALADRDYAIDKVQIRFEVPESTDPQLGLRLVRVSSGDAPTTNTPVTSVVSGVTGEQTTKNATVLTSANLWKSGELLALEVDEATELADITVTVRYRSKLF
jgi:hypothetical protein